MKTRDITMDMSSWVEDIRYTHTWDMQYSKMDLLTSSSSLIGKGPSQPSRKNEWNVDAHGWVTWRE